jgi:hypothetical protein
LDSLNSKGLIFNTWNMNLFKKKQPAEEPAKDTPTASYSPSATPSVTEKDATLAQTSAPANYNEKELEALEKKLSGSELARIQTSDPNYEYPTGLKLGLTMLALCLSVFLVALDNTIIATAIPKITDHFNSLNDVGWYGSAVSDSSILRVLPTQLTLEQYLLTTASFQLLFGKFYTFFSIKWVYLIAIFIFELGSLICGVAPSSTALIVGRAIAGLGCAGIFSGALIIIAYSVPLQKRPIYTGFVGAMYGIASVAGPLLGGAFTDKGAYSMPVSTVQRNTG